MATLDVIKACLQSIHQLSQDIEGAVVYLDAGCTESFQFLGAFTVLLELGVRAVCGLESMDALDVVADWNSTSDPGRKIVVMTSQLLSTAHRFILRCLSTHKGVNCCTIFTSISEISHSLYPDSPLGPDAYHEYELLLLQDYDELIKNQESKSAKLTLPDAFVDNSLSQHNLVVSVHHFPMILCPFSPRVFVLPSEGLVAESYLASESDNSISHGLPPTSTGLTSDGDDVPPGAALTAHFLYHLASKMDLKLEIFSLGDLSKVVGKILTDMSSLYDVGRRKKPVGLLLIDRTLDLLTPCCHGDSLVDRLFSSLPRREKKPASSTHLKGSESHPKGSLTSLYRPPLDVQIPLANLLSEEEDSTKADNCGVLESIKAFLKGWDYKNSESQIATTNNLSSKVTNEKSILNGSFVSTENFSGTPYLEAIMDRRMKEGVTLLRKWLKETMRRENIIVNTKTMSELRPMIKALAKTQSSLLRNRGIIQLAAATVFALDESQSARWDAFTSAEKMLSVSAGDTSQSLASQIGDLINKTAYSKTGLLSFQDALLLTITGYILAGENFLTSGSSSPFSWQEEHFLKEAVVDAVVENPSAAKLKFLHGLKEELEKNSKSPESMEIKKEKLIDDFDDDQWGNWGDENYNNDSNSISNKESQYGNMQLKLELRDRVDNFFKYLHKLSTLKRRNMLFGEGSLALESNFRGDFYTNKGLLYKVLTRVLSKSDIPGLEYHSSTVGRLFKSGFGRFGLGQAKPSLGDQHTILVFVMGGINGVEVREAQEAIAESGRPDVELVLGGTTFLTPDDMSDLLLGNFSTI